MTRLRIKDGYENVESLARTGSYKCLVVRGRNAVYFPTLRFISKGAQLRSDKRRIISKIYNRVQRCYVNNFGYLFDVSPTYLVAVVDNEGHSSTPFNSKQLTLSTILSLGP